MRTTINLDPNLLKEAKQIAARTGRTLGAVIDDALRTALHTPASRHEDPVDLPVYGRGGVQPGVDLDDSASLLEVMERSARSQLQDHGAPQLTRREAEILRKASTGATNKEIAQDLGIDAKTVGIHLDRIFEKLGSHPPTKVTTAQDEE